MKKFLATIAILFLLAGPAFAAGSREADKSYTVGAGTTPTPKSFADNISYCFATGDCTLCDALLFLATIAQWILGTVGALVLFVVIWGGFDLLTSGGASEKVEAGKKKISTALIGLLLVLAAWLLVNAIIGISSKQVSGAGTAQILLRRPTDWSKISCD